MTFVDHCQVPLGAGEHITVCVILDGATTLLTAEAVTTTQEVENITVLKKYFDQYHLQPKSVVRAISDRYCWDRTHRGRIELKQQFDS